MDSPSANVSLEVGSLILVELFFPLLCESTALCGFTGARLVVAKSRKQTGALGSNDGNGQPSSKLMKEEALL